MLFILTSTSFFMSLNIAGYRKVKGFTQLDLANEADIGLAQIKRIETAGVNTSI